MTDRETKPELEFIPPLKLCKFVPQSTISFEDIVLIFESIGLKVDKNSSLIFNDSKYENIRKYFVEE